MLQVTGLGDDNSTLSIAGIDVDTKPGTGEVTMEQAVDWVVDSIKLKQAHGACKRTVADLKQLLSKSLHGNHSDSSDSSHSAELEAAFEENAELKAKVAGDHARIVVLQAAREQNAQVNSTQVDSSPTEKEALEELLIASHLVRLEKAALLSQV